MVSWLTHHCAFPSSSGGPCTQALALLQAALGGLPLEDWTLRGEQTSMLDVSARLLGCCAESLAVCGRGGGLGCAVSLRLQRSVRLKMWMDTKVCFGDVRAILVKGPKPKLLTFRPLNLVVSVGFTFIAGLGRSFVNAVYHRWLEGRL